MMKIFGKKDNQRKISNDMRPTLSSTESSSAPVVDSRESKHEMHTFVGEQNLAIELLAQPITNHEALDLVLHRFLKNSPLAEDAKSLHGLHCAIDRFEAFLKNSGTDFEFYRDLLPKITHWALEGYTTLRSITPLTQIPLAEAQAASDPVSVSIKLTRAYVRSLLSHAFFLNAKSLKAMTFGELSFKHLYNSRITIAYERMVCVLSYFYQVAEFTEEELKEEIEFKRIAGSMASLPKWDSSETLVMKESVSSHINSMEESEDPFFISFANKQLHVGEIIASCTQEEVLFNMAPESLVSLLLVEQMADHEIVAISNLKRFSTYTGFMDSFRFSGFYPNKKFTFSMLALDAVYQDHWKSESIRRDLNKAYLGFRETRGSSVAAGNWGCGVFGGDTTAKFVQQLCAATLAGSKLNFSTFGDPGQRKIIDKIMDQFVDKKLTVSTLYTLLIGFEEELQIRRLDTFLEFLTKKLDLTFK